MMPKQHRFDTRRSLKRQGLSLLGGCCCCYWTTAGTPAVAAAAFSVAAWGGTAAFPPRRIAATRLLQSRRVSLHSTLHHDGDNGERLLHKWFQDEDMTTTTTAPPFPPPEDAIALSGDVLVLFLYTYLDHSVNEGYVSMINSGQGASLMPAAAAAAASTSFSDAPAAAAAAAAAAAEASSSGAITVIKSLPVWFDATHNAFGNTLSALTPLASCEYAPAFTAAGPAFIFLTASWLWSGQVFGAFSYQYTLECPTHGVLQMVMRTWIVTAHFMIWIALASHAMAAGHVNAEGLWHAATATTTTTRIALTKADAQYIVDSLSVLVMWRFVLHHLMGGGYQYGGGGETTTTTTWEDEEDPEEEKEA